MYSYVTAFRFSEVTGRMQMAAEASRDVVYGCDMEDQESASRSQEDIL